MKRQVNVERFRRLAKEGQADAQFHLGRMYYFGEGVPQDYKEAEKWFRKSAEQGHARAQYNLGFMYAYGEGVPKDHVKAYAWFDVCIANGYEDSNFVSELRDFIAKNMEPEEIDEGQKLSREWFGKYQPKE